MVDKDKFELEDAIKLAQEKHKEQKDKSGKPYIEHPLTVMNMLEGENPRMTGVLHDIVEDTDITFSDLIGMGCPDEVIEALKLVTHDPAYNGTEESYLEGIKKIAESDSQIAKDVKWADLTSNSDPSRIANPTEKDLFRWKKYEKAKDMLRPVVSRYLVT